MVAGIILPFLATVAGKVIADVIWPTASPQRPQPPQAAPAGAPTFAQALAAQAAPAPASGSPAGGRPVPAGGAVALDGPRGALPPMIGRMPWVPGALTQERGDPASRVEAV